MQQSKSYERALFARTGMCNQTSIAGKYMSASHIDGKANMIISGGENTCPSKVENCAGGNEQIENAAVIGIPYEELSEQVTAVIVFHKEQTATPAQTVVYCKGRVAGYKVPKNIISKKDEEMPRTGAGRSSIEYCGNNTGRGGITRKKTEWLIRDQPYSFAPAAGGLPSIECRMRIGRSDRHLGGRSQAATS